MKLLQDRGLGPEQGCLGPAVVCGFFVQERYSNTGPGDCEGMFIKAADSDTRKGLAYKKQQESPGWVALSHCEVREKGASGQVQGGFPGRDTTALCSPGCKFRGGPLSLGEVCLWGKK